MNSSTRQLYNKPFRKTSRRGQIEFVPHAGWGAKAPKKAEKSSYSKPQEAANLKSKGLKFKRPPVLNLPYQGKTSLKNILSRIEKGSLHDSNFRDFLADLECTPFEQQAKKLCDYLFQFIKKNLNVQSYEEKEIVAIGCAIRKLIFNLSENELSKVNELLKTFDEPSALEKMICKALVDRFGVYPSSPQREIATCLFSTIERLLDNYEWNDAVTDATLGQAIIGFLCYSDPKDSRISKLKELITFSNVPKGFLSFHNRLCHRLLKNIDLHHCEIDKEIKRNIMSFLDISSTNS